MSQSGSKSGKATGKWIEYYARFGYAAKGIVYGSSGLLALLEALDLSSGETVGSSGALRRIAEQPFGRVFLPVLAFCLMGYVVWRFIQAFLDPEHSGCNTLDVARRISYVCSGLVYAGVAYSAVEILESAGDDNGRTVEQWVVEVMQRPFGRWLICAGGLIFFGIGCYYFYRAIKAEFRKRFKLHRMSAIAKAWATVAGQIGIAARGVVYTVIGIFGMRAAWNFDAEMIKTTEEALAVFEGNPTDELILATLGTGFIAYGIHMGFQAVYRSIEPM
ncbi:MAG: DUF1206 domain-containing protein [Cyanobacteria bacterium J06581_3]